MKNMKINVTKNYRLFTVDEGNRELCPSKHRRLLESMKKSGFIPAFPIVCRRVNGALKVPDGQHRLHIAEQLGLPVYWVEYDGDIDIAAINNSPIPWGPKDYATLYANAGNEHYQIGLDFASRHGMAIGKAFALLRGVTQVSSIKDEFQRGDFKVTDKDLAETVASAYTVLCSLSSSSQGSRMIEALILCCRLPEFSVARLLENAKRCRDKLVPYSTTDSYLQALEDIYNHGRRGLYALRVEVQKYIRKRQLEALGVKAKQKSGANAGGLEDI